MEKRIDGARDSLLPSTSEPELAISRRQTTINFGLIGAALWSFGAALSTIVLALEERSDNALLRSYQDVSSTPDDRMNIADNVPVGGNSPTTITECCYCRQHRIMHSRIRIGVHVCLLSSSQPRRLLRQRMHLSCFHRGSVEWASPKSCRKVGCFDANSCQYGPNVGTASSKR